MGRQRNASCSSGGNGTRGSQPARSERNVWSCSLGGLGRNRQWKQGLAYRTTEETDLLRSERGPVDREGSGVPQNGGNGPPTVETGDLLIGRGVAYRKTGLHGILFISTVDPLQPLRATVDPPSTSSSLHLRLFIHGLLFI